MQTPTPQFAGGVEHAANQTPGKITFIPTTFGTPKGKGDKGKQCGAKTPAKEQGENRDGNWESQNEGNDKKQKN